MLAFPTCKSQIAAIGPRGDLDFVSTTPLHPQPEDGANVYYHASRARYKS